MVSAKQSQVRCRRADVERDMVAGGRTCRGILAFLLLPDRSDRAFFWRVEPPPHVNQLLANPLPVPLRPAFFITQLTNEEHHGTSSAVVANVVA